MVTVWDRKKCPVSLSPWIRYFSHIVLPSIDAALDYIRNWNEEQERELTLAQRDLLRRGDARLVDPETRVEYVLVPVAEDFALESVR